MSARANQRPRIGVNAQLLALGASYHSAGSSRYLYSLLRELRALDAPEEVLAYLRPAHLPPDLQPTERFRPRYSHWPTERAAARIVWEQLAFPGQLRDDGVDLLHGGINALPLGWRGRSVVTILDLSFIAMPWAFKPGNRVYLRVMTQLAARRARSIIAISESTRRDVIRWLRAPAEHVHAIHCGVEERFAPVQDQSQVEAFRQAHDLPEQFILYLGTIEPRKNLLRLLEAYASLRRRGATTWPLVLAGGRGWGYEPVFERAAREDLRDTVRFAGFVTEDEKPLWYNAATLFVYPSEYEGFGLPPLEALACGTPVVTSDRSSIPEVTGEAAMLVDPTQPNAIADGMQRVIDDESLRQRLSSAGPAQARPFTWRRMAEATLAVYREAMHAA
jgi:glycosyltransferase involved in cell wall biosynthesis